MAGSTSLVRRFGDTFRKGPPALKATCCPGYASMECMGRSSAECSLTSARRRTMPALNSFCGLFDELSLAFALFAFSQDGSLQFAPNRSSQGTDDEYR